MSEKGLGYYTQRFDNLVRQELSTLDRSQFVSAERVQYDDLSGSIVVTRRKKQDCAIVFNIVAQEFGYVGDLESGNRPAIYVYDKRFLVWAESLKNKIEQMTQAEGVPITVRVVQEYA